MRFTYSLHHLCEKFPLTFVSPHDLFMNGGTAVLGDMSFSREGFAYVERIVPEMPRSEAVYWDIFVPVREWKRCKAIAVQMRRNAP